jgi:hypothetical protein
VPGGGDGLQELDQVVLVLVLQHLDPKAGVSIRQADCRGQSEHPASRYVQGKAGATAGIELKGAAKHRLVRGAQKLSQRIGIVRLGNDPCPAGRNAGTRLQASQTGENG